MNNVLEVVADKTGTKQGDWILVDGVDSGCGVDYWLENKHTGLRVYANYDQGYVSVEVLEYEQ